MSDSLRSFIAIDLKSFYASVECTDHGYDPLTTNLVVADPSRTDKTICLAVSPALKSFGIPGRPRLFEVVQKVAQVNALRRNKVPYHRFRGSSCISTELLSDPSLELNYIVAPPRMARYLEVSSRIYNIYLRHISPDDIHVYSIDEVFIDATEYLKTYRITAHELAMMLVREVLKETGITATAGIGTNMYLCKIAMDIVAKHMPADKDGVRIAELDERSYREKLWDHRPLTDFWRLGRGYAEKLEKYGIYTMGDIARCSLGRKYDILNEDLLYKLFGVNAELLIDHAWGWENCLISDIKQYRPESSSLSSGQVLKCPYSFHKSRIVIREMADALALDMVENKLVADQIVITVGYDTASLNTGIKYNGDIETDYYGRKIPKTAHGSINLGEYTSCSDLMIKAVTELFDRIVDSELMIRRMYVVANHVIREQDIPEAEPIQLDFFTDIIEKQREITLHREKAVKENSLQKAIISIKNRYGKNALLKGMNFEQGATAIERNAQIGGHLA